MPTLAVRPGEASGSSARPEVAALVPVAARRILELGPHAGELAQSIKERQDANIVGLEIDPVAAERAERILDRVVVGDAEALLADAEFRESLGTFDCVIAADVLEHMREPWDALRRAVALLEPRGSVVISLPNARYLRVFEELFVRGRWPRESEGHFDATHLRWFTLADALDLLRTAGAEPVEVAPQNWLIEGRRGRLGRVLVRTPLEFLAYGQYVIRAQRPG